VTTLVDAAPRSPPPDPSAIAIIPAPRTMTICDGSFPIDLGTEIIVDDDAVASAIGVRLGRWLGIGASFVRRISAGAPGPARAIVLRLESARAQASRDPSFEPPRDTEEEAYTLDVSPQQVVVRARHPAGLHYGAQTLAQLASSRAIGAGAQAASAAPSTAKRVPCVHITDAPAHRFRAMHLDVARHFFSKEVVERYVDLISFYRFNVFHWHLVDDQGFRLAIRSHPELTKIGATRMEDGHEHAGSYTQEEAREVVAYAKERFVTVVPEIEMPGHARAILAAHPELSCTGKKQDVPSRWGIFEDVLCAGNEGTFTLLGDIIRETTEVFPSQIIHLGGDEVPKTRWKACPKCRARMAKENLDAEHLQGAFMKRAGSMLAAHGRRMAAWDEAIDGGLAKDGVVLAWQSSERGAIAARAGYDVVMTPGDTTYFNYWQSRAVAVHPGHSGDTPWTKVLAFEPVPAGLEPRDAAHVLGAEGTLWTEFVRTENDIDTLVLPRLAALSELVWHGPVREHPRDEASFAARFAVQRRMLDASAVRYFVEPPAGLRSRKVFVDWGSLVLAPPKIHPDGVVRFTLDGSEPTASSPIFVAPVELRTTTPVATRLFLPGGRTSDVVRGTFEKSALRPTIQPSKSLSELREGALYKYFEGEFKTLPDFAKLTPKRTGRVASLGFDPSFRAERFANVYDAWVVVPADGVYRFVTRADDGVALEIDGVRVVVDDGEHATREAEGEIALAQGPHTLRITYFQGGGGKHLSLQCEGPGAALGPCKLFTP
jgi:hexosaminidase